MDISVRESCIRCGLCHIACEDTAHQAITAGRLDGRRVYEVMEEACVGCNLCLHVCPAPGTISMKRVDAGGPKLTWPEHPNNPMRTCDAAE